MSSEVILVEWITFGLNLIIILYAFKLSKSMGNSGLLTKATMYVGFAGLALGIEHLIMALYETTQYGSALAESVEGIAALLLLGAVYQLYVLTRDA